MKKIFTIFALSCGIFSAKAQTSFTPGNLVIYRVGTGGTGSTALNNRATRVYLDERNPATGALVRTIAIPANDSATAGTTNKVLTASGTATSDGLITRSADGRYLVYTGYNSSVDTSTSSVTAASSVTIKRMVGTIDALGNVNTSLALSNVGSGNNVRSAVSEDGTSFWIGAGNGGIKYAKLGDDTAINILTAPGNIRGLELFGNQIYFSSSTTTGGRKITLGRLEGGFTNKRSTFTRVNGVDTTYVTNNTTASPYQFTILKLNAGYVMYIADNGNDTIPRSGIQKYSLVDTSWVYNGAIKKTTAVGIVGTSDGTGIQLFATSGNRLFKIIDNGGYNAPPSDTAVIIARSTTNTAFRGIAFAPVTTPLAVELRSFTASLVNSNVKLNWATASEVNAKSFVIEKSLDAKTFAPLATLEAKNIASSYTYTDLSKLANQQYYRLKFVNNDGRFTYSNVVAINGKSATRLEVYPNPVTNTAILSHPKATEGAVLKITTIDGKLICTFNVQAGAIQTSVDVSYLKKANYFVTFENNGSKAVTQFIK